MPSQPLFLPEQVISQVLSSYCDGRSISCFFNVLRGSRDLCPSSFDKIVKDALVHRYKSLAKSCEESALADKLLEVYCVMDMVREEIRTSSESSVGNGRFSHGNGKSVITKVAEWCCIVDYFEMMNGTSTDAPNLIVWCGPVSSQFGEMQHAHLMTSAVNWTVTAMHHFYRNVELTNVTLVPPALEPLSPGILGRYYGDLTVSTPADSGVMHQLRYSMNTDQDSLRGALVFSDSEYAGADELAMGFTRGVFTEHRLELYWDGRDECDFDESVHCLGENALRIMSRLEEARRKKEIPKPRE